MTLVTYGLKSLFFNENQLLIFDICERLIRR